MSLYAYHFRKLTIDLDRGDSHVVPIAENVLRESVGGCGLGVRLLLQTESAELDALDPSSSLFFVFSPLVGSPFTTSAKFAVVSKSPLTHRINDSLAGSGFAIAGKRTGFDAIEIKGQSDSPVVLVIDNGRVRIEPADQLWGKSIPDTESKLKEVYGNRFRIACIGPAGENGVRFATISHDGRHAGRGGSGAVLGAKNVKAILVAGDRQVQWAHPDKINRAAKELSKKSMGPATAKYRELGTVANLLVFNRLQCLPTRNFADSMLEGVEALSPESLQLQRTKVRGSCAACTIGCEHIYSIRAKSNSESEEASVRVEYESLFALGPMCGITNPETVLKAAKKCDELGMDTISTGGTIAFAMECAEKGMLGEALAFGDDAALLNCISEIATRSNFGDQLANGSRQLASDIGSNAISFAPQIKGLEIPGYDPRKLTAMALGFAVGTRGADHNKSSAYEVDFADQNKLVDQKFSDELIQTAIELEDKAAVMDSLILCKFLRNVFDDFFSESASLLNYVTGWNCSAAELRQIGQSIVEDKKRFNQRAGWHPDEDQLPEMIFDNSRDSGQALFSKSELSNAIQTYNLRRGWTADGYLAR